MKSLGSYKLFEEKKNSSRMSFDELAAFMPIINKLEQTFFIGGDFFIIIKVKRSQFGANSTVSTYTTEVWDHCGNKIDWIPSQSGVFLEPKYDPSKATIEGSNTAIKAGMYTVTKRANGRYDVNNVPGRTDVEIHTGTTYGNTTGCLLAGKSATKSGDDFQITAGTSSLAFAELGSLIDTYGSGIGCVSLIIED